MKKRLLLAVILLSAITESGLRAENVLPTSAFAFPSVQEGGSARAIALGSTYVGIDEGSAALLWNPAGLGGLQDAEIALHHTAGLLSTTEDTAVVGLPLGDGNALGVSLNFNDNGTFTGRDDTGALTGDYSANGYGASLGWGFAGPGGFSLGLTAKANRQSLDGTNIDAVAGDAGLLWSLDPALTIGASYTNFGPDVQGRQLAQGFRLGLSSYVNKCQDFQWLFALSGEAITNGVDSVHVGVEHTLYQFLALRAGYAAAINNPDDDSSNLLGWTFGGGIIVQKFTLDYAFVPLSALGNVQRLSLTYSFGDRCAPVEVVSAAPVPVDVTPTPTPIVVADEQDNGMDAYTVKKGDTLWDISGKFSVRGDSTQWPLLYDANNSVISDPDKIYPGQELQYKKYYTENEIDEAEETASNTPPYKK